LCDCKGLLNQASLRQRLHLGHGRQRGATVALPAGQQLAHQRIGALAADGAHQRDASAAGLGVALPKGARMFGFDGGPSLGPGLLAVGVRAIDGGVQQLLGQHLGLGLALLPARHPALALALPHRRGKGRSGQLLREQILSRLQQVGLRQGAQAQAQAVARGAGAELGPKVGPSFGQGVFVQRRALAVRLHARAQQRRRGLRQPGLGCWVTAAAGVEVDLHIEHGQSRSLHQMHPRPAGLHPVLDGRGGLGGTRHGQGEPHGPQNDGPWPASQPKGFHGACSGNNSPTVSRWGEKWRAATACTCCGVTALRRCMMRSELSTGQPWAQ